MTTDDENAYPKIIHTVAKNKNLNYETHWMENLIN